MVVVIFHALRSTISCNFYLLGNRRARTGSGKTAAYGLPVLQKILHIETTDTRKAVRAIVLVPTRELCEQVGEVPSFPRLFARPTCVCHYHSITSLMMQNLRYVLGQTAA